jgi:hypothetical protein
MRPQTDRDADVALVRFAAEHASCSECDNFMECVDRRAGDSCCADALNRLEADLNAAEDQLAEVEAERDALIRGTAFGFGGYLTTLDGTLTSGAAHDAAQMAGAVRDYLNTLAADSDGEVSFPALKAASGGV